MQSWVFLCSLDTGNLLQKNVIVFFFGNQISKCGSFEKKRLFLTYFSHFLVTRVKLQKFLQHISHSHIYMYFAHPIDFFALPILKKQNKKKNAFIRFGLSLVRVLVLILICAILEWSINNKMVSKIYSTTGMSTTDICYTNAKFIVICKPRTLNGGGEDSVQYRNRRSTAS